MTGDDVVELWMQWTERKEEIMNLFIPLPEGQRLGQFLMNELYRISPTVEHLITGSLWDPFHNNRMIPEFFKSVDEHFSRWERNCRSIEFMRAGVNR